MGIKRKYTVSRAVTRSGRPFVGRVDKKKLFRDTLHEHQRQVEAAKKGKIKPRVLNFWGVPGIGKSELLAQLQQEAQAPPYHATIFAGVEFEPGRASEIDLALRSIRREAKGKYKVSFPTFDVAFAIYWKVARPDYTLQESQFPFRDEVGIAGDLLKTVADAPVVEWFVKITKVIEGLSKPAREWWTKLGQRMLTGLPFLKQGEILQRLPILLATDLEAHQRKYRKAKVTTPLVIYFDAYESLWGDRRKPSNLYYEDAWVRELIRQLPSALFVVSGQQPLRWQDKWPEWTDSIISHELKELAEKRVEEFLTGSGVKEPVIRERIASGSRGVPFYLELSVNAYLDTVGKGEMLQADQFGNTFDEIFIRFLRNLKEYEQSALKVLSAARSWDKPLAKRMLSTFTSFPPLELDEFHKFSFVKHDSATSRYFLHYLMRFHLTEAEEFAEFHQREMHPWLREHYTAMLEDIDIKNVTEEHRFALAEGFYHANQTYTPLELYDWTNARADPFNRAAEWALLIPLREILIERLKGLEGERRPELATALNNLAALHRHQGEYYLAEPLYKQALEINRTALGETHPSFARIANNLAELYRSQGEYDLAEPLFRQALEIHRTALGEAHPSFATSLNNLALLYESQGKYDLAEPLFRQALETNRTALGETHPSFATSLNNLALLHRSQGKYDLAESLFRQALEIRRTALGEAHPDLAASLNNLAVLYGSQRKYDLAEPLYRQALEISRAALGETHPDFAKSLNNFAGLYRCQEQYDLAEQLYKRAMEIRRMALGETHPQVATCLDNLAGVYQDQGRYDLAEPLFRQALEISRTALGETHPSFARIANNLAGLYQSQGKYDLAEPLYRQALEISRTALGKTHPDFMTTLNNLALLYLCQGKYDLAEPLYKRALEVLTQAFGAIHPHVATVHENLGVLYSEMDDRAKAAEHKAKADAIRAELARRSTAPVSARRTSDR